MEEAMTQADAMLDYMQRHGSITNKDAMSKLGIMSPTRRICDIEKMGFHIKKVRVEVPSRYGNKKASVISYSIEKED